MQLFFLVVELYLVILLCGSLITSLLLPLLLAIVFSSLYMILLAAFSEHEHLVTAVSLEWELFFSNMWIRLCVPLPRCDIIESSMSPAACWTLTKHQHHEGMCMKGGLSSQPWVTSSFLCRGPRWPTEKKNYAYSFFSSFTAVSSPCPIKVLFSYLFYYEKNFLHTCVFLDTNLFFNKVSVQMH